jgi:Ca2+-binding RTX toxin-like protein
VRNPIRSKRVRLSVLGAVFAAALVVAAASAAPVPIVNSDFGTGDFTGWTTFLTADGTIGTPAVVSFDTTGGGASLAARFNVGRTILPAPGPTAGGGIFQSVTTPQGVFNLSADIASLNQSASQQNDCGLFELLVDGSVVASHGFGICAGSATVRFALKGTTPALSAAPHDIRVRITRTFLADPAVTPLEYVDNVKLVPSCGGLDATITGSGSGVVLMGTPGNDVIVGTPGGDVIFGNGGNDTICGGQGNDVIFGGEGNDTLYGDDGTSPTDPNAPGGADSMFGDNGNDTMDGEAGNDSVYGGANDDTQRGGVGNDSVFGEAGNDNLTGDAGKDSLDGGAGNDVLTGSAGDDSLAGQGGNDTLNGDLGPTPPGTLDPVASQDACDGGPDTDTAVFCEAQASIP